MYLPTYDLQIVIVSISSSIVERAQETFFSSSQRVIVKSLADFETQNFPPYIGPFKRPCEKY